MDDEDEHFIILKIWKRLIQKLKQAPPKARRAIDDFINNATENCKHKQEDDNAIYL